MSIDFTDCPVNKLLWYGGANGKKIGIQYDYETYMLKLPSFVRNNLKQDNDNSSINENRVKILSVDKEIKRE